MAGSTAGVTIDAPESLFRDTLTACLAVPRWVDTVVAGRPYTTVDALATAAHAAASPLTGTEVDQALAHHPRIGEKPAGDSASAALSRAEQSASASDDADLAGRLAAGNRAYEERFDRVFLIRAAGRSREEILTELHRRLALDPETEAGIVATELRDITVLRIRQLFADPPADPSTEETS